MATLSAKDGKTTGWHSQVSRESNCGSAEDFTINGDHAASSTYSRSEAPVTGSGSHGGSKGLSLLGAATFIVGEMAGSGILALPAAVAGIGWPGLLVIVFCCVAAGYAAVYLGKSWMLIEQRHPEHREGSRDPFAIIGLKAFGQKMKLFVTINVIVQLFGVAVVFLLLAADLVYDLLSDKVPGATLCDWIIVLGLCLMPLMWLGSPMDISPIAFAAMSCTAVSCVLLVIIFFQEAGTLEAADFGHVTLKSSFLSLGTILFAFGGAATFPTFQNDMREKSKFPGAVAIGFTLMLVLYLPVAGGGYALFGSKVASNIVENVRPGGLTTAIDILMAFHVMCAFLIVINPVNLSLEFYIGLKHKFNWQRIVFRTFVLLLVVFTGLTVPKFGKILNLVGGFSVSLTTFILPPIFYIRLAEQEGEAWEKIPMSRTTKGVLMSITALGLVGGTAASYSAISDLLDPNAFTSPCYAN